MNKSATTTTVDAKALPKAYDPRTVEDRIYAAWLAADVFAPDGKGSRADPDAEPFVMIQPPPNITGALHLGHALTFTVEDAMVRYARMTGRPTLWLPGLDSGLDASDGPSNRGAGHRAEHLNGCGPRKNANGSAALREAFDRNAERSSGAARRLRTRREERWASPSPA